MTILNFNKATSLALLICVLASCSVPSDPRITKETAEVEGFSPERLSRLDTNK